VLDDFRVLYRLEEAFEVRLTQQLRKLALSLGSFHPGLFPDSLADVEEGGVIDMFPANDPQDIPRDLLQIDLSQFRNSI
jgi:hypothetical protein